MLAQLLKKRLFDIEILHTEFVLYPHKVSKPDIIRRSDSEASTINTLFIDIIYNLLKLDLNDNIIKKSDSDCIEPVL